MATKQIKTRIQNKYDTESNWGQASFVPLKGELIFYDTDLENKLPRFKVGDGKTSIGQLPLVNVDSKLSIDKKALRLPIYGTNYGAAYGNGVFCVACHCGDHSVIKYALSKDGLNWSEFVPIDNYGMQFTYMPTNVLFANDNFYIVTNQNKIICVSSHDDTFGQNSEITVNDMNILVGSYNVGGKAFIADENNYVRVLEGTSVQNTDLWSVSSSGYMGICYVEGQFVAFRGDGDTMRTSIYTSIDGISWKKKTEFDGLVGSPVYYKGKFYTVADYLVESSVDGTRWVNEPSAGSSVIDGSLKVCGNKVYLISEGYIIRVLSDEEFDSISNVPGEFLTYGEGVYISGGQYTFDYRRSYNGETWPTTYNTIVSGGKDVTNDVAEAVFAMHSDVLSPAIEAASIVKDITTVDDSGKVTSIHVGAIDLGSYTANVYEVKGSFQYQEYTVSTPGFTSNGQRFMQIRGENGGEQTYYDNTFVYDYINGWVDDAYKTIEFDSVLEDSVASLIAQMGFSSVSKSSYAVHIGDEQFTDTDISEFKASAKNADYVDHLKKLVDVNYKSGNGSQYGDALSIKNDTDAGVAGIRLGYGVESTDQGVYVGNDGEMTDPWTTNPRVRVDNKGSSVTVGTLGVTESFGDPTMGIQINDTQFTEADMKKAKGAPSVVEYAGYMTLKSDKGNALPLSNNVDVVAKNNTINISSEIICAEDVFYTVVEGGNDPSGSTAGHSLYLYSSTDGVNFNQHVINGNTVGYGPHITFGDGMIFVSENLGGAYVIYVSDDYGKTFRTLTTYNDGSTIQVTQLAYANGILAINCSYAGIYYYKKSENFKSVYVRGSIGNTYLSVFTIQAIDGKFWIYEEENSPNFHITSDLESAKSMNVGEYSMLGGSPRQAFASDGLGTVAFLSNNGYVYMFKNEQYVTRFDLGPSPDYWYTSNITYGCGRFITSGIYFDSNASYETDAKALTGSFGLRTGVFCGKNNVVTYIDGNSDGGSISYSFDGIQFTGGKYALTKGSTNVTNAVASTIIPAVVEANADVFSIRNNIISDNQKIGGLKFDDVRVGLINKDSRTVQVFPKSMESLIAYGGNSFLWEFDCNGTHYIGLNVELDIDSGLFSIVYNSASSQVTVYRQPSGWVDDSYRYITNFQGDGFLEAELPNFFDVEVITNKEYGVKLGDMVIKENQVGSIKLNSITSTKNNTYEVMDSTFIQYCNDMNLHMWDFPFTCNGIYYTRIIFNSYNEAFFGDADSGEYQTENIINAEGTAIKDEYRIISSTDLKAIQEMYAVLYVPLVATNDGIQIGDTASLGCVEAGETFVFPEFFYPSAIDAGNLCYKFNFKCGDTNYKYLYVRSASEMYYSVEEPVFPDYLPGDMVNEGYWHSDGYRTISFQKCPSDLRAVFNSLDGGVFRTNTEVGLKMGQYFYAEGAIATKDDIDATSERIERFESAININTDGSVSVGGIKLVPGKTFKNISPQGLWEELRGTGWSVDFKDANGNRYYGISFGSYDYDIYFDGTQAAYGSWNDDAYGTLTFTSNVPKKLYDALSRYSTVSGDTIKIGNTTLTEEKLAKIINFIDNITVS